MKMANDSSSKHRAMEMANDSSSTDVFKSYLDSEINSVIEPNKDKLYFGSIMYTSGCVEVLEPKQGSLIEWHSGGGKPAMFGDNNSATAIRLTPMGAAVFYNGIMNRNKDIAIRFDGNPPFTGRGAISFAMNVAQILRTIHLLDKYDNQ